MSAPTRFRIVGYETLAVGIFLVVTFLANQLGPGLGKWLPSVDSDLPIVGGALVFVGLETLSLARRLPNQGAMEGVAFNEDATHRFNLRELMTYDIRLHGGKIILSEFLLAFVLGGVLASVYLFYPGIASPYRLQAIFWLGFAFNCLTVLLVSGSLVRRGLSKESDLTLSQEERGKLRRYSMIIVIFLVVPFATFLIGLHQGLKRTRDRPRDSSQKRALA